MACFHRILPWGNAAAHASPPRRSPGLALPCVLLTPGRPGARQPLPGRLSGAGRGAPRTPGRGRGGAGRGSPGRDHLARPRRFPEALRGAGRGSWRLPRAPEPPLPTPTTGCRRAMARALGSWLGCCLLVSVMGMVPPPKNVRMNSVNFKNILQWESPAFPKGNLTFTAQYLSYRKFQDKCSGTALMECDFSSLSKYGDYILRVRAEFADEHSEWVNITFCPVDDTIIGPPRMQVEVVADSLHIRFLAPQIHYETTAWTMKSIYDSWVYNLQYWKNGTDEKFQTTPQYDFTVIRNLEPQTTYCIQVQGFLPDWNKTGEWSEPLCEQTATDETTPLWMVAIILIASIFVAVLVFLGCCALVWYIYKKTKDTFSPGTSLPQHLKEFLGHPHHSILLLFPLSDENEVFDKLSVITEDSESNKRNSGDSSGLRPLSGQGPHKLVSAMDIHSADHSDPLLLTSA